MHSFMCDREREREREREHGHSGRRSKSRTLEKEEDGMFEAVGHVGVMLHVRQLVVGSW
jgi:hypothetical protein